MTPPPPAAATQFHDEGPLAEETIRLARLTIAAHATDAADCARLFDILGIGTVTTDSAPEPKPEPTGPAFRSDPEGHVPVADLVAVVERLKYAKDWSRREIAKRAGVNASTLIGTCGPSHPHKFVRKDMYLAVLRLAQEHGV